MLQPADALIVSSKELIIAEIWLQDIGASPTHGNGTPARLTSLASFHIQAIFKTRQ